MPGGSGSQHPAQLVMFGNEPRHLRVDSVHQGDELAGQGVTGVYHINLVDEVTQWECVVAVEKISEHYLLPALTDVLPQFPFVIHGFHSDNGGEFINKVVAKLLKKLLIEQTRSRPRHSNDNGLVETKNGAVVRKHLGHAFIPSKAAQRLSTFYQAYLNTYLNYHRPCAFATMYIDAKGRTRKQYDTYLTPFEKLCSLDNPQQYLRHGVTMNQLKAIAKQEDDNTAALRMQKAKKVLFTTFTTR